MSETKPPTKAEADRAARLAREAAALRENLRRRKQQGAVKSKLSAKIPHEAPKSG